MSKRVYIETYGCQMNEADTELMYGLLRHDGYEVAPDEHTADVVLLNTCSVRDRAEERIFGRLGWLKTLKAERPGVVLGITGCMAERMREALLKRAPYVDLLVGPDAYRRLPALIEEAAGEANPDPLVDVRLDRTETYEDLEVDRVPGISGWIPIQRGCDKFCTFCVVPFTRGRERSLPPEAVVRQAEEMAKAGFKEITLLGQTVSSYYERGCDFSELLTRVCAVDGIRRVRFMSPYPNDFSDRLIDTLASLPKVGRHLHLPVQSGSTRLLADMRRGYTAEAYLALIDKIRARLPDFALSTDVIVGYPTETDAEYEETLALLKTVRFDSAFMFQYSERPGTLAARSKPDDIPEDVKGARLQQLITLQEAISAELFAAQVGREVELLVYSQSRRDPTQLVGRTSGFKPTIFPAAPGIAAGDLVSAVVTRATSHTLFAELKDHRP